MPAPVPQHTSSPRPNGPSGRNAPAVAVFALLCVAAQGAGLPRWSRTMATASRWVSPEPAENA